MIIIKDYKSFIIYIRIVNPDELVFQIRNPDELVFQIRNPDEPVANISTQ
jgi:hypothetical protein